MAQLDFDRETVEAVVTSLPNDLDAMLSVIGESR